MHTKNTQKQDIAVIGMACRFPGASDYRSFWDNLVQGKTVEKRMPIERLDRDGIMRFKQAGAKDLDVVNWGNFIDDLEAFDAQFFGISDKEAETMEPEQRIMLELTWNCLEDACIRPSDLSGKNVGVFVSEFGNDYKELVAQNIESIQPHHTSGTAQCIVANRISYYYNFTGPSMTIDTACSGSLTTLHVACQSIYQGDSKIAVVAGGSTLLSPLLMVSLTQMRMLSPTGCCKSFDDLADGYTRGEGAAVILLKSLEDAIRDGDHIHGIIKGSAINHGGKVRFLTRPNDEAQADLIVQAVKNSGVLPGSITYLETHGTGTPKGDPIEIEGIKKAYAKLYMDDKEHDHCNSHVGLGTAKSSIGHLEAAAGLAGIIKVLLSMEHQTLPKLTRFQKLNHRISLEGSPFYIVDSTRKWEQISIDHQIVPRRAGVSAFGFGGSNGHVILEEAPERGQDGTNQPVSCGFYLIVLSAKTTEALNRYRQALWQYLTNENFTDSQLENLQQTLLTGREFLEEKMCIICDTMEGLKQALSTNVEDGRMVLAIGNEVSLENNNESNLVSWEELNSRLNQCEIRTGEEYLQLLKIFGTYYLLGELKDELPTSLLGHGVKIPLPGYCFHKKIYQIPYMNIGKKQLQSSMNRLLHKNCSNFARQYYRSAFYHNETGISYMKVNGTALLSSAMLCEMAREAIVDALEINNTIVLLNGDVCLAYVRESETLRLKTEVKKQDNGIYSVEITDEKDESRLGFFEYQIENSYVEHTHPMNNPKFDEEQELSDTPKDLQVWYTKRDGNKQWLHYSFTEVNQCANSLNIIDYVLQGTVFQDTNNQVGNHIHIKQIRIDGPCKSEGVICLEYSDHKECIAITICDLDGNCNLQLKEIEVSGNKKIVKEQYKDKLFQFVWKPESLEYVASVQQTPTLLITNSEETAQSAKEQFPSITITKLQNLSQDMNSTIETIVNKGIQHIVIEFDRKKELIGEEIIADQKNGVYLLYEFVKQLLSLGYGKLAIHFTIVTYYSQYIKKTDQVYATNAGVWGLMGVVAKEIKKWNICLIDGEKGKTIPIEILVGLKKSKSGLGFGYRNETFYTKWIQAIEQPVVRKNTYKMHGVYVIVGGAGGIGQVLTRYLIENYKANVIWLGRRKKDADIDKKIEQCEKDGIRPEYLSADVKSEESLQSAHDTIHKKYGVIHGVVHSAIGALDRSIQEMTVEEYQTIVSVKVDGAVRLAQVFGKDNLDFIVFFSSISSVQKLAGQSGYVTGSTFLDMFAYQLSAVERIHAKSVNWGYWGKIGIGQSMPDSSIRKIEMSGMGTINPESAMQAMEYMLDGEEIEYMFTPVEEAIFKESFPVVEDDDLEERREELQQTIMKLFREFTSLPLSVVKMSEDFEQYGINEITMSRYLGALHHSYPCVTSDMFQKFSNLNEIAEYILENEDEWICTKPKQTELMEERTEVESIVSNMDLRPEVKGKLLERTISYLKTILSEEMGVSSQRIKNDVQLEQYGLDSIMIIHLSDLLKEQFVGFESTEFFQYTTVLELANYMTEHFSEELQNIFHIEVTAAVEAEKPNVSTKMVHECAVSQPVQECHKVDELAIVGMSGRFPMADNLNEYWENMKNGRDCITEIPEERWDLDGFYTPDVKQAVEESLSYSKWGGFLNDFASFDPMFFEITPKEAMSMDPQERLFLEESYRVLEDAGYTKKRLADKYQSNVGVFVGVTRTGYEWYGPELRKRNIKVRPSTSFSSIANRVAYYFNLHGPSLAIDTMCSSSLSALHVACESVRHGNCHMAIAGGVNIYTHPSTYEYLCQLHMLSKTGRCHTFGADADGFVPGEGVGAILIKPLEDAIKDRDNIYAIIRGSNINHGGKTNGFTVPSLNAQRDLVAQTFKQANVTADMVGYIEAHGTGTILGDPIEVSALSQAFAQTTNRKQFCAISSVKTNIGHLEGAAGIAGVIKTVLQMKHKVLVPHIHTDVLNPRINFKDSPFYVPEELKEWKRNTIMDHGVQVECPRIAGVSAFGAGGTNAHVVLEEYDPGIPNS